MGIKAAGQVSRPGSIQAEVERRIRLLGEPEYVVAVCEGLAVADPYRVVLTLRKKDPRIRMRHGKVWFEDCQTGTSSSQSV